MLKTNDVVSSFNSLYIANAIIKENNSFNEDVFLLYNPDGYGGVLTIGKEIVDIIDKCNGINTVSEIASKCHLETDEMLPLLDILLKKQMIHTIEQDNIVPPNKRKKELTCWIHLTNDCNLRCKYCYIHKNSEIMHSDILFKSVDKMFESCKDHSYDSLALMLVGGEPLTQMQTIKRLVSYCNNHKSNIPVRFIIPTNGTLITKDVAKFLADNHISVGVSLDGLGEYHDANRINRNGKGSFKDTIRGIDNLIEHNIKPSIMVTVTSENLDGLYELTKYLINKQLYFRFSFERDTQTGYPSILHNSSKCIKILNKTFDYMEEALNTGLYGWFFQFGDVSFSKPVRRACGAGKNFFALGQNGEIGSCSLGLESPRSNISGIQDVISDVDSIFSDISHTSACDVAECKQCTWRHSCAGACPLQTIASYGNVMHISPYCELYKKLLPRVLKIYAMSIYYKNKIIKKEA